MTKYNIYFFVGAYGPFTVEGNIVVNGIVASCYAGYDQNLAHFALTPLGWFPEKVNRLFGNDISNPEVCSFRSNFTERQVLWSFSSVDFHTLTLQLPIQTPNSVVPELQVFVSSLQISAKRAHPSICQHCSRLRKLAFALWVDLLLNIIH